MCSIALRWLPRRLLMSLRSPMMCSKARRRSSAFWTCKCSCRKRSRKAGCVAINWSTSTCSSPLNFFTAPSPPSIIDEFLTTLSTGPLPRSSSSSLECNFAQLGNFLPQAVQLFFQGDHLQFAADHHLLEFLQVQYLFLQLGLGLFQIANHLLVGAHVAENADGPDHLAV